MNLDALQHKLACIAQVNVGSIAPQIILHNLMHMDGQSHIHMTFAQGHLFLWITRVCAMSFETHRVRNLHLTSHPYGGNRHAARIRFSGSSNREFPLQSGNRRNRKAAARKRPSPVTPEAALTVAATPAATKTCRSASAFLADDHDASHQKDSRDGEHAIGFQRQRTWRAIGAAWLSSLCKNHVRQRHANRANCQFERIHIGPPFFGERVDGLQWG
jgi:hypothetical protein